jgi:hypothetical protein
MKHGAASLERALQAINRGIARLQEYRTAMISAAVTGQIDVRGDRRRLTFGDR